MKYIRKWQYLIFIMFFVLSNCARPELTRRYKTADYDVVADTRTPAVAISAFVMNKPSDFTKPTLFELTGDSQKAYISSIVKNASPTDDAIELLGRVIEAPSKESKSIFEDRTTYHKRIVISSLKNDSFEYDGKARRVPITKADRIDRLLVDITIDDPSTARFTSCNRFSTEYGTVDLGSVSLSQKNIFKLEGSIGAGGVSPSTPVSLKPSATWERNLGEELKLSRRYINLSGTLTPQKFSLVQESVAGNDLEGNAFVDCKIVVPHYEEEKIPIVKIKSLKNSARTDIKPASVELTRKYVKVPRGNKSIHASFLGKYKLRHVVKNHNNTIEGLQGVEFVRGGVCVENNRIVLISKEELEIPFWRVRIGSSILFVRDFGNMHFASYEETLEFVKWLSKNKPLQIGGQTITLSHRPVTSDDYKKEINIEIFNQYDLMSLDKETQ